MDESNWPNTEIWITQIEIHKLTYTQTHVNTCKYTSTRNHLFSFYLRIKVPKLDESVSNCDKIVAIFWEVHTIYFAGYFIASYHRRCLQIVQYQTPLPCTHSPSHRDTQTDTERHTHTHAHTQIHINTQTYTCTHLPVPHIDHHIMLVTNRHKILQIGRECLQDNT